MYYGRDGTDESVRQCGGKPKISRYFIGGEKKDTKDYGGKQQ